MTPCGRIATCQSYQLFWHRLCLLLFPNCTSHGSGHRQTSLQYTAALGITRVGIRNQHCMLMIGTAGSAEDCRPSRISRGLPAWSMAAPQLQFSSMQVPQEALCIQHSIAHIRTPQQDRMAGWLWAAAIQDSELLLLYDISKITSRPWLQDQLPQMLLLTLRVPSASKPTWRNIAGGGRHRP